MTSGLHGIPAPPLVSIRSHQPLEGLSISLIVNLPPFLT
jgi:hypothetical protein